MWKCNECGFVADELRVFHDMESGDYAGCPKCGMNDVSAAFQCEVCGEVVTETHWGACLECYKKMADKLETVRKDMTDAEYALFCECIHEG